jgi:hypothetical protein
VRRNVRGHADGDAAGAVHQQIRKLRGKNRGFPVRFIVGRDEVDRLSIDVVEELRGDAREPRFSVSVRRCGVAVDGSEVALPVDERVAHAEELRHADERVVHARITVGVVFAEHLADDVCALLV